MNKLTSTLFATFLATPLFAQINSEDSTVQAIGYWDKKEQQAYAITSEKYKVKGTDTTDRELTTYEVAVTIKDSNATSYTIEWLYKKITTSNSSALVKKLSALSEGMKIVVKTDEMGSLTEVVNWVEVKNHIKKSCDLLKKEFKDVPKIDEIITELSN